MSAEKLQVSNLSQLDAIRRVVMTYALRPPNLAKESAKFNKLP